MTDRPSETKAILKEQIASLIAALFGIPHEHAKLMTAEQVRSLIHFDHNIHHVIGGPYVHWNVTPRLVKGHREKTAKVDRPQIAKTDRITKATEEFRSRILSKTGNVAQTVAETKTIKRIRSGKMRSLPDGFKRNWKTGRVERVEEAQRARTSRKATAD